jgi:acyl-homoserine lactone acylase PvdQ
MAALLAALACGVAADLAAAQGGGEPRATIRRTAHGIPHVIAGDWRGLGFGDGYALAQDNICTIAEAYVTVRGERSRFFGPDEGYVFQGNGFSVNNLNNSLSENPDSPYYADQTRMFSNKEWVDVPYCEPEIAADPELRVTPLNGGYRRPAKNRKPR